MGKERGKLVKIQHYIPRFFLANFSNEKNQLYECLVNQKKIYPTNISNSMSERYTYEHSFFGVNLLEKYFNRIENYMVPAVQHIKILLAESEKPDLGKINSLVIKYMREFLIFYYRSGALLYEFAYDKKTQEDRILLMLKNLISSKYIKSLSETIVNNYNFSIIKSEHGNFLLSDQFISTAALGIKNSFSNISNRQMGLKNVLILIPISKYYYFLFSNGRRPSYISLTKVNTLNNYQEEEINKIIINNSYNKCVCNHENVLNTSLTKFEYRSPITILAGYKSGLTTGSVLKKEVFFYEQDEKAWLFFESTEWLRYRHQERNDCCLCGSGKKFKKCHMDLYLICDKMMSMIEKNVSNEYYIVSKNATIERPIDEWSRYSKTMKK